MFNRLNRPSFLLPTTLALSTLAGCGGPEVKDAKKEIERRRAAVEMNKADDNGSSAKFPGRFISFDDLIENFKVNGDEPAEFSHIVTGETIVESGEREEVNWAYPKTNKAIPVSFADGKTVYIKPYNPSNNKKEFVDGFIVRALDQTDLPPMLLMREEVRTIQVADDDGTIIMTSNSNKDYSANGEFVRLLPLDEGNESLPLKHAAKRVVEDDN